MFTLFKLLGRKQMVHAQPVWAPFATSHERKAMHARLNDALDLLQAHSPARYLRMHRSLSGFLIFCPECETAKYNSRQRVCCLSKEFLLAPDTTAEAVAVTIVHEATHGWLFDLGIGYAESIRYRVEQICVKGALLTARRLPNAQAEIDECHAQLAIDPEYFSDAQSLERILDGLRGLNCPEWLIRLGIWIRRRRAA